MRSLFLHHVWYSLAHEILNGSCARLSLELFSKTYVHYHFERNRNGSGLRCNYRETDTRQTPVDIALLHEEETN
jgi:hypothetical protein